MGLERNSMEAKEFLIKYREYCEKQSGCGGGRWGCPLFDECLRFTPVNKMKDEYFDKIITEVIGKEEVENE